MSPDLSALEPTQASTTIPRYQGELPQTYQPAAATPISYQLPQTQNTNSSVPSIQTPTSLNLQPQNIRNVLADVAQTDPLNIKTIPSDIQERLIATTTSTNATISPSRTAELLTTNPLMPANIATTVPQVIASKPLDIVPLTISNAVTESNTQGIYSPPSSLDSIVNSPSLRTNTSVSQLPNILPSTSQSFNAAQTNAALLNANTSDFSSIPVDPFNIAQSTAQAKQPPSYSLSNTSSQNISIPILSQSALTSRLENSKSFELTPPALRDTITTVNQQQRNIDLSSALTDSVQQSLVAPPPADPPAAKPTTFNKPIVLMQPEESATSYITNIERATPFTLGAQKPPDAAPVPDILKPNLGATRDAFNVPPIILPPQSVDQLLPNNIVSLDDPFNLTLNYDTPRKPEGFTSHFLRALSTWSAAIPIQSFWAVVVWVPKSIYSEVTKFKDYRYDNAGWEDFNIDAFNTMAYSNLYNTDESDKYVYGCMFARSIGIPGERIDTAPSQFSAGGGLLFPDVIKQRANNNSMQISFMETNVSYVDTVLRPWSIVASYLGLVAREPSIKGTIQAIFYAKSTPYDDPNVPQSALASVTKRKVFTFEDVVPTDINVQEYSQRGDSLIERPCKFYYSRYSVSTGDIDSNLLYRGT